MELNSRIIEGCVDWVDVKQVKNESFDKIQKFSNFISNIPFLTCHVQSQRCNLISVYQRAPALLKNIRLECKSYRKPNQGILPEELRLSTVDLLIQLARL
jgi:hypothetical protein